MMNSIWTIIGSVGTSLIASGGLVWLCREWISARLTKSIQHEYDIKLEDFKNRIHFEYELKLESNKKDLQRVLDEYQIRFKYWYDEKSKAEKILYSSLSEMYYSYVKFVHEDTVFLKYSNPSERVRLAQEMIDYLQGIMEKCFSNWLKQRLYLDDEEDAIINKLFLINSEIEAVCIDYIHKNNLEQLKSSIKEILIRMSDCLKLLRKSFQHSLQAVQIDFHKDSAKEKKEPDNG